VSTLWEPSQPAMDMEEAMGVTIQLDLVVNILPEPTSQKGTRPPLSMSHPYLLSASVLLGLSTVLMAKSAPRPYPNTRQFVQSRPRRLVAETSQPPTTFQKDTQLPSSMSLLSTPSRSVQSGSSTAPSAKSALRRSLHTPQPAQSRQQ
jgi:hypothetical protein